MSEQEIAAMTAEIERLRLALREHIHFNPIRQDLDAYLFALAEWALTGQNESDGTTNPPTRADFGLDEP